MKINKLAMTALLLWFATAALFAWFFVHGNTMAGTDSRNAISLKPGERDFVLREMRGLLSSVQAILQGLNQGDMRQVASAAHAAGTAAATDLNPVLMTKLPLPFKQLGMSVHHDMDQLAEAAESGKPAVELQAMLAGTLSKCVACHASWQLNADN